MILCNNRRILDHVTIYESPVLYETAVGIQFRYDSCFVRQRENIVLHAFHKDFPKTFIRKKIVSSELTWVPRKTE